LIECDLQRVTGLPVTALAAGIGWIAAHQGLVSVHVAGGGMRLVEVKQNERSRDNEEPPDVSFSRSDPGILEGGLVRCRLSERSKDSECIGIQMNE
jgi:hypothetical protein